MNKARMNKHVLNIHITTSEHAWLKGFARHEGVPMTTIIRDQIRESMRRELAMAGIEAGIRCYVQDCFGRPEREGLCIAHAFDRLGPARPRAASDEEAIAAQARVDRALGKKKRRHR